MDKEESKPPLWDNNELTDFFELVKHNQLATYHNARGAVALVIEVDAVFKSLCDNLNNLPKFETGFFIQRSHAAYRAGMGLSFGGQVVESNSVYRTCLENALYGLYINQNDGSFETWMRRHDDENSLKKVRAGFSYDRLSSFLKQWSEPLYRVASKLYERTIDYGGHPNERAFTSNWEIAEGTDHTRFDTNYLAGNPIVLMHSIKTGVQVGVCSLDIFQSIYKERFAILGLEKRLDIIKSQLANRSIWEIVS